MILTIVFFFFYQVFAKDFKLLENAKFFDNFILYAINFLAISFS